MKKSHKIIFGLLALAGAYYLIFINLLPTKTNTPSTGLLADLGIGSSKTNKSIKDELSDLKTNYDSVLNRINSLESKVTTAGLSGKNVYTGNGLPANSLGVSGDSYIDVLTGNVYQKGTTW
jgi:hypothetical protein